MPPENDDLRSTIEEAFDAATPEEGRPATDTQEPVRAATETTATSTDTATTTEREDGRDEHGRFLRGKAKDGDLGDAGKPGTAAAAPGGAPADAAKQVDEFAKPPQSWKPGAREAWAHLPPDVRAEVHRREREAQSVLQETTQARQVFSYLQNLEQRYGHAIQAEGAKNVIEAAENLMGVATKLRFGTPVEKASLIANYVRHYGIDIQMLDNALAGLPPVPAGAQPQGPAGGQFQDPRVDQLLQQIESAKQQRQQQAFQAAADEVETFGSDKEFFADVRDTMADLLEVASRRGLDLTLQDAYDRACLMNPDIAKVIEARRAAQAGGNRMRSTQAARNAASSVRGTPASVSTSQPGDLRGAIESAIEQVGGR
jgi:hypothetical protein